jgi:hypothetical protein
MASLRDERVAPRCTAAIAPTVFSLAEEEKSKAPASGSHRIVVILRCTSSRSPPAVSHALPLPTPRAAMSDVHADAAAHHTGSDALTFASLPLLLSQRIFLTLPVDSRGRACCVSRA